MTTPSISLLKKCILFSIVILAPLTMPNSAEALRFGAQLIDHRCGGGAGSAKYTSPSSWSSNIYDSDHWGADCFRIYLDNTDSNKIPANTDVRFAIRLVDEWRCGWMWSSRCHSYGSARYTSWASEGGGWSSWASHNQREIDGVRVLVQTRTMPLSDQSVGDIRLSLQTADVYGGLGCDHIHGSVKSTPLNVGWTSWATDSDASDPNCLRVKLEATLESSNPPSPTLSTRINNGSWNTPGSITIDPSDTLDIGWEASSTPSYCNGSPTEYFDTGGNVSGEVLDVDKPDAGSSDTYTVTCGNSAGENSDSVVVNVTTPAPTVSLTADPTTVIYGQNTVLDWAVENATTCSASGGWSGNKSASGGSESTDPLTTNTTYNLTCNGLGGTTLDSVAVSVETGTGASLENVSCNPVVRRGSECDLEWNAGTSEASTCSIKAGNNVISGYSSLSDPSGTLTVTVGGETVFSLDCPGNTDQERIKVLPEFQES